jgi:hypothetical protein
MDGEATKNEPMEVPPPKPRSKKKRPKRKANKKAKRSKKVRARKRNKKARVGRPPRGEGTTVVGVVLNKGERMGVRVADSLFKKLVSGAKAAGVSQSVLLRAGGIYLAELVVSRRWKKAQVDAFLKKYGGAS